jgi:nucleotide-binding universal stress UspA family protein
MRVLFATDGADPSVQAGELLGRLADRRRTQVVVLSVNDFDVAMRSARERGQYSAEAGHEVARRAADLGAEALLEAGIATVETRVEDGDEASEIVHAAEHDGFELVVVGTGKERWLDTVVLGSVSSSVVHASPCPVLVVHRAPEPDRAIRVLVGADGSEGSSHAVAAFAELADPERCAVTVITVAAPPAEPRGGAPAETDVDAEVADDARRSVDAAATVLTDAGFRVETEVVSGNSGTVLLERAERLHADLVVVGARGLGHFRAKVLGSVSERVLRKARATLVGR